MVYNLITIIMGITLFTTVFEFGLKWISFFGGCFGLILGLDGFFGLMRSLEDLFNPSKNPADFCPRNDPR